MAQWQLLTEAGKVDRLKPENLSTDNCIFGVDRVTSDCNENPLVFLGPAVYF